MGAEGISRNSVKSVIVGIAEIIVPEFQSGHRNDIAASAPGKSKPILAFIIGFHSEIRLEPEHFIQQDQGGWFHFPIREVAETKPVIRQDGIMPEEPGLF